MFTDHMGLAFEFSTGSVSTMTYRICVGVNQKKCRVGILESMVKRWSESNWYDTLPVVLL